MTARAIADEPVRGAAVYPGLAALPGIGQLRAFLGGDAADPPVARLTGRRIAGAGAGTATYELPLTGWLLGARGVVHPGVLALLADGALVATVISGLPARTLCTTAELSLTFLGAPRAGPGALVARGRLVHLDAEMGLGEVFITGPDGRLVAHGTSRCSVFGAIDDAVELHPPAPPDDVEAASPDPFARPAPTAAGPPAPGLSGVDLLRAQLRGERPAAPVDRLMGIELRAAEEGRVTFAQRAHPWLMNEWGTVHGGATALLAMSAASAAVQATAPTGTGFTALDVKVNLLRGIPVDGRELTATGTVLHRGRRLAIATSEVMAGAERAAVATGTTALVPPR